MFQPDEDGIYAHVAAAPARRIFAYGVQFGLGALLIYVTLAIPPSLPWMIFMLGFGIMMIWQAERMRRATMVTLELTETDLRDSTGAGRARIY